MKNYKIVFGGRGADLYIHKIDENQKQQLQEMRVTDKDEPVDFDKLNEVLKVENWDYTDESYTGAYTSPELYHISVFDEDDNLVWESDEDFYMDQGEEEEDYKYMEKQDVLMIEHYVKGVFKEYKLETEEDFNPEKLSTKLVDINEEVEIIVDLKYDNKELELDEWGDYWSKGTFFHTL